MASTAMATGGQIVRLTHESRALKGNPLGDPHVRELLVYLPRGYRSGTRRHPVVYLLTGFTGKGASLMNFSAWGETIQERLDRLARERKLENCLVVMPDCFTAYGGSQYLNSSATGRYEDYLVRELVPFIDRRFRTIPKPEARAIAGKSSGGYGALVQGMRHPDVFGLVACHSGDMYFELCYKPDFARYLKEIAPFKDAAGFLRRFPGLPQKGRYHAVINTLAMAACYSPRPGRPGFALPFDERTGELNEAIWHEWLAHDPAFMAERHAEALKRLRLLYLDCGTKDEFNLQFGARILAGRLRRLGVRFVHEEFDDGHMNISYRYDRSFALIGKLFRELR